MSLGPSAHHGLGPSKFPAFAECAAFESAPEEEIDDLDDVQKVDANFDMDVADMASA